MPDEMKYAKLAYIIPFQKVGESREPVLLINTKHNEEVIFSLSLFFIGLTIDCVYDVSYSIRLEESTPGGPVSASVKKFKVSDVLGIEGLSPSAFEVPVTIPAPVVSGQYRLEAILTTAGNQKHEARTAIAFIDIRAEE
ncbi:hypothetical protein [Klebsiella michiganensis]|uniref:hypothetical protein n=1 Tax=Klebsiella michiganensis TaxID=1134687 RepID=UPI00094F806F|nr:hypothetical protein [Klebsiella michiganensis]